MTINTVEKLGQFGLGGVAVGFLGYVMIGQIPALTLRIDANTEALTELRVEMERSRKWQSVNDPGAEKKVKAAIPPE